MNCRSFLSNSTKTRLCDCNMKDDFFTCKILRFKRNNLDFSNENFSQSFLSLDYLYFLMTKLIDTSFDFHLSSLISCLDLDQIDRCFLLICIYASIYPRFRFIILHHLLFSVHVFWRFLSSTALNMFLLFG